MKPPPSEIWHDAARKIARKEIAPFSKNQVVVLDFLFEHFRGLYVGAPNQVFSKDDILSLSKHLSQKTSSIQKKERFDFLARGLENGNLTLPGWDVPLGPVYIKINREENFARQDNFRQHDQAETLLVHLDQDLKESPPENLQAVVGQILISAILLGGLLNRKYIKPFQDSLLNKQIYQEGSLLWVEMSIFPGDTEFSKLPLDEASRAPAFRLPLDHMTRLLLYRYLRLRDTFPPTKLGDPWIGISAYFQRKTFPQNIIPRTLKELFSWAFALYLKRLPHSLVAYAAGKLPATCLPFGPWLRTVTGLGIPIEKLSSAESSDKPRSKPQIVLNRNICKSEQEKFLSDLLKSLRFNKKTAKNRQRSHSNSKKNTKKVSPLRARRAITLFLNRNKGNLSVTLQLLLHWSIRLLTEKVSHLERRKKDQVRTTSVDSYLLSFGYALLQVAGDLPLHNLDPQDLETIYEQTAMRIGKKRFGILRLRQFHGFLQTFFKVPTMEWGGFLESGITTSSVNANLISPQVYQMALESFGWGQEKLSRWQTLHIIALIFLYRCGLRPSEAQALRLEDIQGVTRYELLIQNTIFNDIKTNNGIRRICTFVTIPQQELEFLLAFLNLRRKEDSVFRNGFVFFHPTQKEGLLSDEELFSPIRKVLRGITADETLLLYHLRHSFLSWHDFILKLDKAQYSWTLPVVGASSEDIERVRTLGKTLARNEPWGRKEQYILAMLGGHSNPEITHRHYCHLLDMALHLHLLDPTYCPTINYHTIKKLTGLGRSMSFKLLQVPMGAHNLGNVVRHEAEKFVAELRHPLMANAFPMQRIDIHEESSPIASWEEAITQQEFADSIRSLLKFKPEWDLAAKTYEAVRNMSTDGRKLKTVKKVIIYSQKNYIERHGGIRTSSITFTQTLIDFFQECGITKSQIILVYHPQKNEEFSVNQTIKKWASEIEVPVAQIFTGEKAPVKLKKKCLWTVKICAQTKIRKVQRIPKTSLGFRSAIELLAFQIHNRKG